MTTARVTVARMKTAQVPAPGADFQIVEREIPQPGPGWVRIKVQACGVCHSEEFTKENFQWYNNRVLEHTKKNWLMMKFKKRKEALKSG
jgi:hypothetical protein